MKSLELKVPPAIVVFFFALLMWLLTKPLADFQIHFLYQDWLAWLFYALGGICTLLGVHQFRKANTTVDPRFPDKSSSLVCTGIFRFSRNPIYLGFLLILIGWAIQLAHFLPFLPIPLFVVYMNYFQIIPEERSMQSNFGSDYQRYKAKVRRWF